MKVEPGRLLLAARDSRSDWYQQATTLSLRLVSGPGIKPAANEAALIARIAGELPSFVDYWRKFKDGFFGFPSRTRWSCPSGETAKAAGAILPAAGSESPMTRPSSSLRRMVGRTIPASR